MIDSTFQFVKFARMNMFTEEELNIYADRFWPYMDTDEKLSLLGAEGVTKNWIREKEGFPPLPDTE